MTRRRCQIAFWCDLNANKLIEWEACAGDGQASVLIMRTISINKIRKFIDFSNSQSKARLSGKLSISALCQNQLDLLERTATEKQLSFLQNRQFSCYVHIFLLIMIVSEANVFWCKSKWHRFVLLKADLIADDSLATVYKTQWITAINLYLFFTAIIVWHSLAEIMLLEQM